MTGLSSHFLTIFGKFSFLSVLHTIGVIRCSTMELWLPYPVLSLSNVYFLIYGQNQPVDIYKNYIYPYWRQPGIFFLNKIRDNAFTFKIKYIPTLFVLQLSAISRYISYSHSY